MARRPRYSFRPKRYPRKKPREFHLKAGADARLRKIFAEIGVPGDRPFKPDPFQIEALAAIEHGDCLVTAPTGAGKTWIAEQAIARIHAGAGKAWYACPLKALSNAKYAEFSAVFGRQQVGILTGDRKENPDAPIIVGTTEILRNQLYDAMYRGELLATDFVVLDEAHFLGDTDRGVVWEEIKFICRRAFPFYCFQLRSAMPIKLPPGFLRFDHLAVRSSGKRSDRFRWYLFSCTLPEPCCR